MIKTALLPAETLDLGNGVKLELVLIPAGKFVMGTPTPVSVDERGFRSKILTGQVVLTVGGGVLAILVALVVTRAIRKRQRPQYSLAWFLAMTLSSGIGLLGCLQWYFSVQAFARAQSGFQAASARLIDSYPIEKPDHEVTLTKTFYIGKCEVTQEQYQQVMGNNPSQFKRPDLPVEQVFWDDAQEFSRKASEKTGLSVRLPTDAEWEYACRAGTRTTYCSGDAEADLDRVGWYNKNSGNTTHPVGQKAPNAWGVYDMHGNVWEWCADRFEEYKSEPTIDPQAAGQDQERVLRGGSWYDFLGLCRSANRSSYPPGLRESFTGFRVAVEVGQPPAPHSVPPTPKQP